MIQIREQYLMLYFITTLPETKRNDTLGEIYNRYIQRLVIQLFYQLVTKILHSAATTTALPRLSAPRPSLHYFLFEVHNGAHNFKIRSALKTNWKTKQKIPDYSNRENGLFAPRKLQQEPNAHQGSNYNGEGSDQELILGDNHMFDFSALSSAIRLNSRRTWCTHSSIYGMKSRRDNSTEGRGMNIAMQKAITGR
ncbi:Hypothetical_protein [Hexamita inflata]|uniref:Hypothetical_protein n=1 Tax=Hexamita inflata TaxID=28002 RepID=A0ABP1I922_9EUKA